MTLREPATDLTKWRLSNVNGCQMWRYLNNGEEAEREMNFIEKHALGLELVSI